jgi:hypothetical protein
MLLAHSEEFLKDLLVKYGATRSKGDIFKSLLKAKLSDKFRRMQRKHRQKALAAAAALCHVLSRKPDPAAALQTFAKKMNVSRPRGAALCRTIVECFFDYGGTAEERTHNRQYACTDANALRYIVRKGIEPQKDLAPEQGESITKWAKREAKYRRPKTPSDTPPKVTEPKRSKKSEWTDRKFPVLRPSEKRFRFLKKCARTGVFLVEPEANERPLVVTVTELTSLTVDEAKRRPKRVRAAIEKTLDKLGKKGPAKLPTALLARRHAFDARRSSSPGPHPAIPSKPGGLARFDKPSFAPTMEGPRP